MMPPTSLEVIVGNLSQTACFGPEAAGVRNMLEPGRPEEVAQEVSPEVLPVNQEEEEEEDDEEGEESLEGCRRRTGSDAGVDVLQPMNLVSHFRGCERQGHALMSTALNDASRTVIDVQAVVYDAWKAAQAGVEAHAKVLERVRSLEKDDAFGPVLSLLEEHLRKIVEQGVQVEKAIKALVRVGRNYGTSFSHAFKDVKRREIETTKLELALNHSHEFMKQLKDECTRVQFDMSRIKSVSQDFEFKARLKRGRRELMRQADKYECLNQRYQAKFSEFCASAERFLCHNARQLIGLVVGLLTALETHHKDLASCHENAASALNRKSPEALLAEFATSVDIDLQNNELPLTDSECLSLENLVDDSAVMTMAAWEKAYDSERNSPALSRSKMASPKNSRPETRRTLSHVPSAPINVIYQQPPQAMRQQVAVGATADAGFIRSASGSCVAGGSNPAVISMISTAAAAAAPGTSTDQQVPADPADNAGPGEEARSGQTTTSAAAAAGGGGGGNASPEAMKTSAPSEVRSAAESAGANPSGVQKFPKLATDFILNVKLDTSATSSPTPSAEPSAPQSPEPEEPRSSREPGTQSPMSASRDRSGGCVVLCPLPVHNPVLAKPRHAKKTGKHEGRLGKKNSSLMFINTLQRKDKMMVRGPSRNASRPRDYIYPLFDFEPDEEDLLTPSVIKTKPGSSYPHNNRRRRLAESSCMRRESGNDYNQQSSLDFEYLPQMFPAGYYLAPRSDESVSGNVLRVIIREELDNILDKLKYRAKEKNGKSRKQVRVSVCAENILEACLDVNSTKSRTSSNPDCTVPVLATADALPGETEGQSKAQWVFSRDSKSLVITGTLDGSSSKESKFLRLVNIPCDKPISDQENKPLAEGDAAEILHLPSGKAITNDKDCDDDLRHVIKEELESLLNILKEQVKKRYQASASERSESDKHVAFSVNCEAQSAIAADSGGFDAVQESNPSFPHLQESTEDVLHKSISNENSKAANSSKAEENHKEPKSFRICKPKPSKAQLKPAGLTQFWWDDTSSLNSVPIVGMNGGQPVVSSFKLPIPQTSAEAFSDNVSVTSTKRPSVSSTDDEFSITDGCLQGVNLPSAASMSIPMIDNNDTIPIIANIKEVFIRREDGFECLGSIVLSLSSELAELFKEESNNPEATLSFKLFKSHCHGKKHVSWPGIQIAEGIVEPISVVLGDKPEDDSKSPALTFSLNMKALAEYLAVVARYKISTSTLRDWLPVTLEQHWDRPKPKVLQVVLGTQVSFVGFAKAPNVDVGCIKLSIVFSGKVAAVDDDPNNPCRCEIGDNSKVVTWKLDPAESQTVLAAYITLATVSSKPKFCEVEFQLPDASVAGFNIDLLNPAYSLWDKKMQVSAMNYHFPCPSLGNEVQTQSSVNTMGKVDDLETSLEA
ncbi:unnamed protein product [Notodromas monacha]|uniref:Uncharacterized protein n=1 Tax=Notodromas monacha TaxID=399045 RepID=A0A7R9BL62_9CRUS|nr:unnamed protein product [Notodromas monacha]CAG0916675.1 unnamed protein product [Notodromas monacha]